MKLKNKILDEIGTGVRDEEDLILCFPGHADENVLDALHELDSEDKLNSNTTAGHTAYAKPGNEPWKEEMETPVKGNKNGDSR
jgi:hypothetical protein